MSNKDKLCDTCGQRFARIAELEKQLKGVKQMLLNQDAVYHCMGTGSIAKLSTDQLSASLESNKREWEEVYKLLDGGDK